MLFGLVISIFLGFLLDKLFFEGGNPCLQFLDLRLVFQIQLDEFPVILPCYSGFHHFCTEFFTDFAQLLEAYMIHESVKQFLNDEQLSMYDVLMKDDLSKDDIKKLKVVAKELLEKIKEQLATMDHPFDKQEARASIIITIRDILWKELPESYSDESINYYRDAVYNYVSQHYGGVA